MTQKEMIITEIAVYTPESALIAAQAGADRIELCSGYSEGGLSPSAGTILYVRNNTTIRLHVMIRPRIGDFVYSAAEKEIILQDVQFCRKNNVDGIVFGALTNDGKIDLPFTRKVVETASPMSVTFHRAFDLCTDTERSLSDLIDSGVSRVLTSGSMQDAIQGAETIAKLVKQAGNKLIILPGGGINPDNVSAFVKKTGVKEIHFSAKKLNRSSSMPKKGISLTNHNQTNDYQWFECDENQIKAMILKLIK
jgi:copper homeostasis protein